MQLPLELLTFQYENCLCVRSLNIKGEPWWVAADVCAVLEISDARQALERLDADERGLYSIPTPGGVQSLRCVNESGLYSLILGSRKPEAKKFKKWITSEVLPQIRQTGGYRTPRTGTPKFVRRFNDNWNRVDVGYFSVIGELGIRLYGRLEALGYVMPDQGNHGREMRPDVSVGKLFSRWLAKTHPSFCDQRRDYLHLLPDGSTCNAFQYPRAALPAFLEYVDEVWVRDHATTYLSNKDPVALEYLPKLLPAGVMPKMVALKQLGKLKDEIKALPEKNQPATEESARSHFARMREAAKGMQLPPSASAQ